MSIFNKYGLARCDLGETYVNDPMDWEDFKRWIIADTPSGATVLDAGAGEGAWKGVFPDTIKYIGVDSAVGNEKWDYSDLTIRGDLEDLNFLDDASIDTVICIQVLEHLRRPYVVVQELARVLRPGGRIFISAPQSQSQHQIPHDYFRYTPYGLRMLLEEAELQIEIIRPQLCGDNEANLRRTRWSLAYTIERLRTSGHIPWMLMGRILMGVSRMLFPLVRNLDRRLDRHIHPIGFFVGATKLK